MRRETEEQDGRPGADTQADEPDFKWAVEYLVRERGQRHAARMLGVNRKTVALALRRDRLTSRMNHAVQTLMARDDPETQEVMPLDRIDLQIRFLVGLDERDRRPGRRTDPAGGGRGGGAGSGRGGGTGRGGDRGRRWSCAARGRRYGGGGAAGGARRDA